MSETKTCGDQDLMSTSVRAGDGRRDWVLCGAVATHEIGTNYVCAEHLEKRRARGDDLTWAKPIAAPRAGHDTKEKA